MADCTRCIHEQACNTWMRYLHSIYDDHSYSTEGCPDYMPAADVAPVVHCCDCKHLRIHNNEEVYACCSKTGYIFLPFETDTRAHFCGFGERMDGDG